MVLNQRQALSGDITNTGLPAGTWLDLLIDGKLVESNPTLPSDAVVAPGGTLFLVERVPGRHGTPPPAIPVLDAVHPGSTVEVRVSTSTTPLGSIVTVPLSPLAGAVVATGIL